MDLRCNKCGALNPATNRYCGQCGKQLERVATDSPKEFSREEQNKTPEAAQNSRSLPADIYLNPQISPLAADRTDHPTHEAEAHGEDQNGRKTVQLPGQLRIVYENTNTGVSGPSFLGLSDDNAPEYYGEEIEAPSHLWRNIALCVLGVAVIAAALEWRSIRDIGLRQWGRASALVGSLKVELHKIGVPKPPAFATNSTRTDLGTPAAAAKPGAPQSIEPSPVETSRNANHTPTVQATGNPPNSAHPDTPKKSAAGATAPHAMGTRASTFAENQSPATADQHLKPSPSGSVQAEHSVSRAAALGIDEMNHAERSSNAEERAMWLWRAVGKGNSEAPIALAKMYEQGNGVVRSCDQAQILLRLAAAKGSEEAKLDLRQIHCAPR